MQTDRSSSDIQRTVKKQIAFLRSFMDAMLICAVGQIKVDLFWKYVDQIAGTNPTALASNCGLVNLVLQRYGVRGAC